jgi:hypothetical protein
MGWSQDHHRFFSPKTSWREIPCLRARFLWWWSTYLKISGHTRWLCCLSSGKSWRGNFSLGDQVGQTDSLALSFCCQRNKWTLSWLLIFTSARYWVRVNLEISIACSATFSQVHIETPSFHPQWWLLLSNLSFSSNPCERFSQTSPSGAVDRWWGSWVPN